MEKEKEKIDLLIEKNVAEQFSKINWDRLNSQISKKLDEARRDSVPAGKFPIIFKIAAAIAIAAGLTIAVMMIPGKQPGTTPENSRIVTAELIKNKGSASVEIIEASGRTKVTVEIEPKQAIAKSEVEIIDTGEMQKENNTQASWIIITRPVRAYADNGEYKDMMDIMFLF